MIPHSDANFAACIGAFGHLRPSWMCIGILSFKTLLIRSRSLPNILESHCPHCSLEGHTSPKKFVTAIQVNNYSVGDQHISSFVDSIHLVLHDHEHIPLHTPRSCPHWRSTHLFLRQLNSLSTSWSWARHVAYSSIVPTLESNTSLPSSIWFA
jgi:hypothetical protein